MAAKRQQTHAKRARELAVQERRERKRAKKAETADERAARREIVAGQRFGDGVSPQELEDPAMTRPGQESR
jgi:hypothetical protein